MRDPPVVMDVCTDVSLTIAPVLTDLDMHICFCLACPSVLFVSSMYNDRHRQLLVIRSVVLQETWESSVLMGTASRFKWLRQRTTGSAYTGLLGKILDFCVKDEPINLTLIRQCLHRQVCGLLKCSNRGTVIIRHHVHR